MKGILENIEIVCSICQSKGKNSPSLNLKIRGKFSVFFLSIVCTLILSSCRVHNYDIYVNHWYKFPPPKNIKSITVTRVEGDKEFSHKIHYKTNGQIASIDGMIYKYSLCNKLKRIVYGDTIRELYGYNGTRSKFKYKFLQSHPYKRINYEHKTDEIRDIELYNYDIDSLHLQRVTHYRTGKIFGIHDHYLTPDFLPLKSINRQFSYSHGVRDTFERTINCYDYYYQKDTTGRIKQISVFFCCCHEYGSKSIYLDDSLRIIADSTSSFQHRYEYEFYE